MNFTIDEFTIDKFRDITVFNCINSEITHIKIADGEIEYLIKIAHFNSVYVEVYKDDVCKFNKTLVINTDIESNDDDGDITLLELINLANVDRGAILIRKKITETY